MTAHPNILVILTDQQRSDSLGSVGWTGIKTPHLDRLAASGVHFTGAVCESPECVPARATILTGLPPHLSGVHSNSTTLRSGEWTFPRALRDAGYRTWAIGKQHFRPHRADHGFDRLVLGEPKATQDDDYLDFLDEHGFGWVDEPWGVRSDSYYIPQPSQLPDSHHITTWTGDRTIALLGESAPANAPFLGMVGFLKPHPPFDPTVPFARLYDPEIVPPPIDAGGQLDPFPVEVAQRFMKWREETSPALAQTLRAHYLGSVTQVDVQIGRILEAVDSLGLAERTVIVFLSDHGELLGDHGLWGKRSYLRGSCEIPLIICDPTRASSDPIADQIASQCDLAPTILAAAGCPIPPHLPGRDLLSAVESPPPSGLTGTYAAGPLGVVSRLTTRWRWSYSVAAGRERLFDLAADPNETNNLAIAEPDHPELVTSRCAVIAELSVSGDRLGMLDGKVLARSSDEAVRALFGRNRQRGRR